MNAQVSCTATIFHMHTPAYVALISTQICPIFILMKVYCMCAYNIWCHKNGLCRRTSPRPSHVLAHHPNRHLPLVLRAMHEMENGCLPSLLPSVSGLHTKMHVRAQWQLLRLHCSCNGIHVLMHEYPMMRPQTHHNLPTPTHLHHKLLPHPHHQRFSYLLCVSPFGAETPNPGERLGFNLVCKKCSPQNCKRGGGAKVGWVGLVQNTPPRFPPFSPVFPPYPPPFSLRFPPFSPGFPRFFLLPGTKPRLGTGTLAS